MRGELVWIGLSAGLVSALSALAYGCGQTSSGSCADNGTCPASLEAGADTGADEDADAGADAGLDAATDADVGDGFDGSVCDPSKTPFDDPCVVADKYGVFVSPTGHNGAAGTMADPLLAVTDAITEATGHTDRVYACAGTYDESLVLGSIPGVDGGAAAPPDGGADAAQGNPSFTGGVTLFGGLDCANGWAYTGAKAVLAPTTAGTALTVKGLTVSVTFEDFGFHALAATHPGESSIAVFASQSAGLTLSRCELVAGAGQAGQDQPAAPGSLPAAPSGDPGTAGNNGGRTSNSCNGVAMASVGGAGGLPAAAGTDGQDGTPGPSNKGTIVGCASSAGLGGGAGADGAAGTAGAGAASWATFDQNGWVPTASSGGGAGGVGQGGGGGASVDTSGGGGGGAGGCGGVGGTAGTTGGSSIALLVYQSSVDLETCLLTTADAGRGGNGAGGQVGQARGLKGTSFGASCPGGNGGFGGSGGGGGGGAGGLSVGVVWTGTAPTIDGSAVGQSSPDAGGPSPTLGKATIGSAGAAGMHGAGGMAAGAGANAGADGTDGKSGVATVVMQFQ